MNLDQTVVGAQKTPTIFNLTEQSLNSKETDLLCNGLKFCPTPRYFSKEEFTADQKDLSRKINLSYAFKQKMPDYGDLIKPPSNKVASFGWSKFGMYSFKNSVASNTASLTGLQVPFDHGTVLLGQEQNMVSTTINLHQRNL